MPISPNDNLGDSSELSGKTAIPLLTELQEQQYELLHVLRKTNLTKELQNDAQRIRQALDRIWAKGEGLAEGLNGVDTTLLNNLVELSKIFQGKIDGIIERNVKLSA